jgi:hypothetical protein
MSRHSAKTAGRSAKTASARDKKATKTERAKTKKSAASTRRPLRKAARAAPAPKPKKPVAPTAAPEVATEVIRTVSPPVQPVAPPEPLHPHRYSVGEVVYYTSPSFGRAAASGNYTVVKLLPSDGDDYQYRIKSNGEAFERVAKESQLDKA